MAYSIKLMLLLCLTLLVACLSAIETNAETREEKSAKSCIEKIRAYEDLYRTSKMTLVLKADEDSPAALESLQIEQVLDGFRMWSVYRYVYEGKPDDINTMVSDGEQFKVWSRRETDRAGQGTVKAYSDEVQGWSNSKLFRPAEMFGFLWYEEVEMISHENNEVILSFYNPKYDARYVATYELCGEYMRPLFIDEQLSATKNKPPAPGMQYAYSYGDAGVDGSPPLWPIRIETHSKAHGFTSVYEVRDVDFNPEITDDLFELEFPEGAWVSDETVGISRRYFKAGEPASRIAEGIIDEVEDGTDVERREKLIEDREEELNAVISEIPSSRSKTKMGLWLLSVVTISVLASAACLAVVMIVRRQQRGNGL